MPVTIPIFPTIVAAVAILVDKWVASPRTFCNDFNTSEVAILVGKWVAS
nr:hypothetical protein [Ruminococcus bromii]